MMRDLATLHYQQLKEQIGELLCQGWLQAGQSVNTIMLQTNGQIGRYIVEHEQKGTIKAEYDNQLLDQLSKDFTAEFSKGLSRSHLFQIRRFCLKFPKIQTLSGQLNWSHYAEIIEANSELEVIFYIRQCEKENWSVRELKRQIKSMLFHHLALSKDKSGVLEIAYKADELQYKSYLRVLARCNRNAKIYLI